MSLLSRWFAPGLEQIELELDRARVRAVDARIGADRHLAMIKDESLEQARSPLALALAAGSGFLLGDSPTRKRLARIEDALERVETTLAQGEHTPPPAVGEARLEPSTADPLQSLTRYLYLAQLVMSAFEAPRERQEQAETDDATVGLE